MFVIEGEPGVLGPVLQLFPKDLKLGLLLPEADPICFVTESRDTSDRGTALLAST